MSTEQDETIDRLLQDARAAAEAGDTPRAERMALAAEQLRSCGGDDLESAARASLVSGSRASAKSLLDLQLGISTACWRTSRSAEAS